MLRCVQLTRAVNTGLLQHIALYRSALEGLAGGGNVVDERLARVEEMIRREFGGGLGVRLA